jgi:methionyl-tRNA formyltransferase
MNVIFFGNNKVAPEVARAIRETGDSIVGLVLHPDVKRKFGKEIIQACGNVNVQLDGSKLEEQEVLQSIAALHADIGVSAFFGYILRQPLLELFPQGVLNVHPALLPYGRGANPNVWSIVDRTPAGVTIHYIDSGVDTGDIIAQREVTIEPVDTGETLYRKLERASVELFREQWSLIREGKVIRRRQPEGGTTHRVRDLQAIDRINLDGQYAGRELIDILRARTFSGFSGAYFVENGRRVFVSMKLEYGEDAGSVPYQGNE